MLPVMPSPTPHQEHPSGLKRQGSPPGQNVCVVYQLTCHDCEASYIGETQRVLKQRLKDHQRDSSPVAHHPPPANVTEAGTTSTPFTTPSYDHVTRPWQRRCHVTKVKADSGGRQSGYLIRCHVPPSLFGGKAPCFSIGKAALI